MSTKKKVLIALAAVGVITAVFIFAAFKKIYTPTTGEKISEYTKPGKALLVIDVQEDYTGLKGKQPVPYPNAGEQIAVINKLINKASASGIQVVYIRQLFDNNLITRTFIGRSIEGLPGVELDGRIKVINRNDFTKKISDAFSNPQLEAFLIKNRVDGLYLVGLDAAYCVHKTALGALNRGYKVTVVDDAIMSQKNMSDAMMQFEKDGIPAISSEEMMALK
jgi:nicotinamidase/pyrazinamidase